MLRRPGPLAQAGRTRLVPRLLSSGPAARRGVSTSTSVPGAAVVFSGIQPTGVPHLGNYVGALRPWVRLQDAAAAGTKLFFSVVDLHALTALPASPGAPRADLARRRREVLAALLAVGLDPDRSVLFYQSSVQLDPSIYTYPLRLTRHSIICI